MSLANDILVKVLRTESTRGHDNQAVIGGIKMLIPHWEKQAEQYGLNKKVYYCCRLF